MKYSKIALSVLAVMTFVTVFALAAPAASDVSGTYKSTMETPRGTQEQTFVLKADGDKLTGKVVTPRGETEIKDGKVTGDEIEFTVERTGQGGQTMKTTYKGKVGSDGIKGTATGGQGSRDWTAKKQ
jgi:hypothetical protein